MNICQQKIKPLFQWPNEKKTFMKATSFRFDLQSDYVCTIKVWNVKYKVLQIVYQEHKKHLHVRSSLEIHCSQFPSIDTLIAVLPPVWRWNSSSPFRTKTQGWKVCFEALIFHCISLLKKAWMSAIRYYHLQLIT